MRLDYDDGHLEVMDKVNKALERHGLQFVFDEDQPEDIPSIFYNIEAVERAQHEGS